MANIFISFIHEEAEYAELVQQFIARILGEEVKPFMSSDKVQVYAGEKWLDRIMGELAEAKVVLLMLSDESVKRPWVNFEAGAAWTRNINIIPICFGELYKEDLPKPYSSLQAVGLQHYGDDEYLAKSIAHYLGLPAPGGREYSDFSSKANANKIQEEQWAYKYFAEDLKTLNDINGR